MSILFRDARAGDKPAVIELTRTIWEGEDYHPTSSMSGWIPPGASST